MADLLWPLKKFKHAIVLPFLGAVFDWKGGRFHTDGCSFDIPKDQTARPLRWRFLLHVYEDRELRMVRRFIRADDSVLELGACLGIISCVTNKKLQPHARHVVVEPNPQGISALVRNRDINHATFTVQNCAVAAGREGKFNVDASNITSGMMEGRTGTTIDVPVKSMRQLHQELGPFSVLICDIEGSELDVFEQSADLFKSYRLVIVELHDFLIGDVGVRRCQEIMRRAGLELIAAERGVEAWMRI